MKKINIDNTEKLERAIKEAEGRATARTIEAKKIQYILHDIASGVPKAKMHGTKVYYSGAEHFPNAYKYRPESTHFEAENVNGKWYVTKIWRGTCPNRKSWNTEVVYSQQAIDAILNKMRFCSL